MLRRFPTEELGACLVSTEFIRFGLNVFGSKNGDLSSGFTLIDSSESSSSLEVPSPTGVFLELCSMSSECDISFSEIFGASFSLLPCGDICSEEMDFDSGFLVESPHDSATRPDVDGTIFIIFLVKLCRQRVKWVSVLLFILLLFI